MQKSQLFDNDALEEVQQLVKEIRYGSAHDFIEGKLDDKVKQAIQLVSKCNNLTLYKMLAYALFAVRQIALNPIELNLLRLILIGLDKGISIQIDTVNILFQSAWDVLKQKYTLPEEYKAEPQPCQLGKYVDFDQNPQDPDALCTVNHGGGWRHIVEFLAGKSKGYALDDIQGKFPGFGIYVTPLRSGYEARAYQYALRAATRCCDTPGIFTAKIAQKYLIKTPNAAYEVGVPFEHWDKFHAVKKVRLSFCECAALTSENNPYGETHLINPDSVRLLYCDKTETNDKVINDFMKVYNDMNRIFMMTSDSVDSTLNQMKSLSF
ncbi:MAG: hypothetical protein M3R00_07665 [Pseudomonadota bacterium]|nr:hypothetical protein [Pseudomonadota bacterium]